MARQNQLDAPDYNTLVGFDGDWRDAWWNQDYLELTAARLGLGGVARVLDLGCGVGHWGLRLLPLCAPDAQLTGVDREPSFLAGARDKAATRGLVDRCRFQDVHGEDLLATFGPDAFDLVTCQTVLMHVADAAAVLDQMLAVLRPGGIILVAEPDNTTNAISTVAAPQRDIGDILAIMELQLHCRRGKQVLGHGDDDVGGRLVELFHGAGLIEIDCRSNDRAAFMIPPYSAPRQAIERDMASTEGVEVRRELMRTRFVAGGGAADRFDELWASELKIFMGRITALRAGEYICGGGFMHYLVSGQKPEA